MIGIKKDKRIKDVRTSLEKNNSHTISHSHDNRYSQCNDFG